MHTKTLFYIYTKQFDWKYLSTKQTWKIDELHNQTECFCLKFQLHICLLGLSPE